MKSSTFPSKYVHDWPWVTDYTYDVECYPNFFSLAATHIQSGTHYYFEISEWYDMSEELGQWLLWLSMNGCRQIGFNNQAYDYYMLHFFFMNYKSWTGLNGLSKSGYLYAHSDKFFKTPRDQMRHLMIWDSDRIIPQIDLFKMHHFDNAAKMTSLKVIEINTRQENVEELPVKAGTWLTWEQRCQVVPYNQHDTKCTTDFAKFSVNDIKLRMEMTEKYGFNAMNLSDTKLGEKYFEMKLREAGINIKNRTHRDQIVVKDILFDYIQFREPVFQEALEFLRNTVITDTKSDKGRKYPKPTLNGFTWEFSKGGMHGSIPPRVVRSGNGKIIIDVDVTSYYPCMAIANGLYPLHLTKLFCEIYQGVFDMRKLYEKGTMENLVFKLALNGTYGNSNSEYSCFYDPQFTMTITLNGQLMLCMLGEWMSTIPTLEMIQANTDGITFIVDEKYEGSVDTICRLWEQRTGLILEAAYYDAMHIRDVNNYIAEYNDDPRNGGDAGKKKCKGAYVFEKLPWHKNHSSTIIAEAAFEYLVNGKDIYQTISQCNDKFKFMLKTKVPKASRLCVIDGNSPRLVSWRKNLHSIEQWFAPHEYHDIQNVTRYFISNNGHKFFKVMPPTPKMIEHWNTGDHYVRERDGDYKVVKKGGKPPAKTYTLLTEYAPDPIDRNIGISKDWRCTDCSNAANFNWDDLNLQYYLQEAIKLVEDLKQ